MKKSYKHVFFEIGYSSQKTVTVVKYSLSLSSKRDKFTELSSHNGSSTKTTIYALILLTY